MMLDIIPGPGVSWHLNRGESQEILDIMAPDCVDAVVTDPPYGLSDHTPEDVARALDSWLQGDSYEHDRAGFLGKDWDSFVPSPPFWRSTARVLKPGGYVVAFAGTRTADLMALSMRLGGLEILDELQWIHGQGVPKNLAVSKTIAKRAGGALRAREAITFMEARRLELGLSRGAFEKRIFGRTDGNVRNWEIGVSIPVPGLWPRIREAMELASTPYDEDMERGDVITGTTTRGFCFGDRITAERPVFTPVTDHALRWKGWGTALKPAYEPMILAREPGGQRSLRAPERFYYCPKPSVQEKTAGGRVENLHPTVKPVELMRRLCLLVADPGEVVMDPFMGSGTTAIAAATSGLGFIGMERDPESYETAQRRLRVLITSPTVEPTTLDLLLGLSDE